MAEIKIRQFPYDIKPDLTLNDILPLEFVVKLPTEDIAIESNKQLDEYCRITIAPNTPYSNELKKALTERGFVERLHKNGGKNIERPIVLVKEKLGNRPKSETWMIGG